MTKLPTNLSDERVDERNHANSEWKSHEKSTRRCFGGRGFRCLQRWGASLKASSIGAELAGIRQRTAKYHLVERALADGYVSIPVPGNPGGIDALYASFPAAYDGPTNGIPGVLKLEQPEGLGYVKLPNGELPLASVFFFKPYAPWPAPGTTIEPNEDPPMWLAHEPVANVHVGMWEMEVWLWVSNPNGMFEFYNPRFDADWDAK